MNEEAKFLSSDASNSLLRTEWSIFQLSANVESRVDPTACVHHWNQIFDIHIHFSVLLFVIPNTALSAAFMFTNEHSSKNAIHEKQPDNERC